MKHILLLLSLTLLAGCVTTSGAPTASLSVDFSWDATKKCSSTSPQITVSDFPEATTQFKVSLKDLDAPNWNHGGGTVDNDGSGIIPAGALTKGYNGPCPPFGSHRYQFTVKAVDGAGSVLASGKAVRKFP